MDTSAYLVNIVTQGDFHLVHFRIGAIFTQVLPVAMVHAGASLKAIMISYSINFVITAYAAWILAFHSFRNPAAATAILLFGMIGVNVLFFWPVSEFLQCLTYSILFFSFLTSPVAYKPAWKIAGAGILTLLVVTAHPLSMITVVFVLAIFLSGIPGFWKQKQILRMVAASLLTSAFFLLLKGKQPYDLGKMHGMMDFQNLFHAFLEAPALQATLAEFAGSLLPVTFSALLVISGFLAFRKYVQAILLCGFLIMYFIIYNVSFLEGDSPVVMENMMLMFPFFVFIASTGLMQWMLNKGLLLPVLGIAMATFSFRFFMAAEKAALRTKWHDEMFLNLRKFEERKYVMNKAGLPEGIVDVPWALYSESLLLSALHHPDSCYVLVAVNNPEEFISGAKEQALQYPRTTFWKYDWLENLGGEYFRLPGSNFRLLKREEIYRDSPIVDDWQD